MKLLYIVLSNINHDQLKFIPPILHDNWKKINELIIYVDFKIIEDNDIENYLNNNLDIDFMIHKYNNGIRNHCIDYKKKILKKCEIKMNQIPPSILSNYFRDLISIEYLIDKYDGIDKIFTRKTTGGGIKSLIRYSMI
jgi:hypothetical protein